MNSIAVLFAAVALCLLGAVHAAIPAITLVEIMTSDSASRQLSVPLHNAENRVGPEFFTARVTVLTLPFSEPAAAPNPVASVRWWINRNPDNGRAVPTRVDTAAPYHFPASSASWNPSTSSTVATRHTVWAQAVLADGSTSRIVRASFNHHGRTPGAMKTQGFIKSILQNKSKIRTGTSGCAWIQIVKRATLKCGGNQVKKVDAANPCVSACHPRPAGACTAPLTRTCPNIVFIRRNQVKRPTSGCSWSACRPVCPQDTKKCPLGHVVRRDPLKACTFQCPALPTILPQCWVDPKKTGWSKSIGRPVLRNRKLLGFLKSLKFPFGKNKSKGGIGNIVKKIVDKHGSIVKKIVDKHATALKEVQKKNALAKGFRPPRMTVRCPNKTVVRRDMSTCKFPKCTTKCSGWFGLTKRRLRICPNGRNTKLTATCVLPQCSIQKVCPKDRKRCPNGAILFRDRSIACKFAPCPNEVMMVCAKDVKTCPTNQFRSVARQVGRFTRSIRPRTVRRDPLNNCQFKECPRPKRVCTSDVRMCATGASVARDPMRNCMFRPCQSGGTISTNPIAIPGGPGNRACMARPNTFLCRDQVCRAVCTAGYAAGVVPPQAAGVVTTIANQNQMQNGQVLPALPSSCSATSSDGNCARVCPNNGICCGGQCYARPAAGNKDAFPLIPVVVAGSVVLVVLMAALAYCKSQQKGVHQGGSNRPLNDYDQWASNPSLTGPTTNSYHL